MNKEGFVWINRDKGIAFSHGNNLVGKHVDILMEADIFGNMIKLLRKANLDELYDHCI